MRAALQLHKLTNRAAQDVAAVGLICAGLHAGIAARGQATLVVSGGRSPATILRLLSSAKLSWSKVTVILTDERYVPVTNDDSNERMIRDNLLQNNAAEANFISYFQPGLNIAEAEVLLNNRLSELKRPFDVLLLGMAEDGHIASLFPGNKLLQEPVDATMPWLVAADAPMLPNIARARLTLTPRALLDSRRVILCITGAEKLRTFIEAIDVGPVSELPVRLITGQDELLCDVFWAT